MRKPELVHSKITGGWSAVRCPVADRAPAERFDSVRAVDDFERGLEGWAVIEGGQQGKASVAIDRAEKHAGVASLRVDYEYVGKQDYEYIEVARPLTVEKPGLGLGLWVKGGEPGSALRLRIRDPSGETHQVDLGTLGSQDWRYFAVAFETAGGWWGGDGNRRLGYPCELHSILADRPRRGFQGKGRLWIAGVELVRPRRMPEALTVEVLDTRLGNVYEPGETVELRASGPGEGVRWRVEDYWGREVARGDGPPVRLRLPEAGWYACTLERLAEGRVAEARVFRCAALPPADPRDRNAFVGVCSHFRGTAYPLETMDLMVRYGITQIRDEISWSAVEQEKGKLELPKYGDDFTAHAKTLGVDPLLIFDYGNRHYENGGFPIADESVAAYARYSATLATMLKGRVRDFEVWNEYSIGCGMRGKTGKQTPETYARMLVETHKAVKAARPDAFLVGVGGEHSAHHVKFIEGMMRAGAPKAMDAFSVHSYRYPRSPEETDVVGEIRAVAELARRCDAPDRIWVTEIGWPTHVGPRGVDERAQARLIVRTMALLQATGVVEKVHWYDFKNDGLNREYNEHNFGVVWHQAFNYAPKPAAVALSVFARLTAGAEVQRLLHDGDAYVVLYRLPDGRDLAVAWATEGVRSLSVMGERPEGFDLQGNPLRQPVRPTATGEPSYFIGRNLRLSIGAP